jgi:hypothetical protein
MGIKNRIIARAVTSVSTVVAFVAIVGAGKKWG